MKAIIANYRGSYKTHHPKQMILKPVGIDSKEEAAKLVGKTATWTTKSGKKIAGQISAPHGCKGAVRVVFTEKGLPGQSLGTEIEIQ